MHVPVETVSISESTPVAHRAPDQLERLVREEAFHDQWARDTDLGSVRVREQFESAAAPENKCILRWFGDLRGKRILDLACGLGEASVYFALRGAEVTAVDLSGEMLDLCGRLGALHGVTVRRVKCGAEELDIAGESMDLVYGGNILHHCDPARVAWETRRVLRSGGKAAFYDPMPYNPIINLYRKMATRVRTTDEEPLRPGDVKVFDDYFDTVRQRKFWMTSLAVFCKFYVWDRVHPNEERYWKKVINEAHRHRWLLVPTMAIDAVLSRMWPVNLLCWNNVVLLR